MEEQKSASNVQLLEQKTKPPTIAENQGEEGLCAICMGSYENMCHPNECFHKYCFSCLEEWTKIKPKCPYCQKKITSIIHSIQPDGNSEKYSLPTPSIFKRWRALFMYLLLWSCNFHLMQMTFIGNFCVTPITFFKSIAYIPLFTIFYVLLAKGVYNLDFGGPDERLPMNELEKLICTGLIFINVLMFHMDAVSTHRTHHVPGWAEATFSLVCGTK